MLPPIISKSCGLSMRVTEGLPGSFNSGSQAEFCQDRSRRVKILERTIFVKFMAHHVPPSQLEFHLVLADTDRVCKMS
jgi:hypothetical protein